MRLRFDDCVVDLSTRELWRDSRPVPLSPQAFALLDSLVRSRPRAMHHGEAARRALWPDTHTSRASLARVVCELRRALGDTPRGGAVRTVPRFGYAFAAAVVVPGPARPSCRSRRRPARAPGAAEGETLVGRGTECALRLASPQVSRVHARFSQSGGRVVLEDRGSRNGMRGSTARASLVLSSCRTATS